MVNQLIASGLQLRFGCHPDRPEQDLQQSSPDVCACPQCLLW